jgi:hypothetical protein
MRTQPDKCCSLVNGRLRLRRLNLSCSDICERTVALIRREVEMMEDEARNFYRAAIAQTSDAGVRQDFADREVFERFQLVLYILYLISKVSTHRGWRQSFLTA